VTLVQRHRLVRHGAIVHALEVVRDGFHRTIIKAMETSLGTTIDDATKSLLKEGIAKDAVTKALQRLSLEGKPFTLWNLVDALTHENVSLSYAGDRLEADAKIARLLTLAL
jgi:hypothetical protein